MKKQTDKKKMGRKSKYKPEYAEEAGKLCRDKGYTDDNLAKYFGVSRSTISKWKNEFSDFSDTVQGGKDEFDRRVVEQSLLKRCVGRDYNEITKEVAYDKDGLPIEGVLVVRKIVNKVIMPETAACTFWLKNRQPKRWADKQEFDHTVGVSKPITEEELIERLKAINEAGDGIAWDAIEGRDAGSN